MPKEPSLPTRRVPKPGTAAAHQGGLGCLRADLDTARPMLSWVLELLTVRALSTMLFRASQSAGASVPLLAYVLSS